jgi:hypothetical protein
MPTLTTRWLGIAALSLVPVLASEGQALAQSQPERGGFRSS